jgi:hypothetical protein
MLYLVILATDGLPIFSEKDLRYNTYSNVTPMALYATILRS